MREENINTSIYKEVIKKYPEQLLLKSGDDVGALRDVVAAGVSEGIRKGMEDNLPKIFKEYEEYKEKNKVIWKWLGFFGFRGRKISATIVGMFTLILAIIIFLIVLMVKLYNRDII